MTRQHRRDDNADWLISAFWTAVEQVRTSSYLRVDEYGKPILDLVFLAEANRRAGSTSGEGADEPWPAKLPSTATFAHLLAVPDLILGDALNKAFHELSRSAPPFKEIHFSDFNSWKLKTARLQPLLEILAEACDRATESTFADLFENVLDRFADDSGHVSGEFSAPQDVKTLLIQLLKPRSEMGLYDPFAGTC